MTAVSTFISLYVLKPAKPNFPLLSEQITSEWLQTLLLSKLGLTCYTIKELTITAPKNEEQGMTSKIAFIKITWSGSGDEFESLPKSIVVKCTSRDADLGLRVLFRLSKLAEREAGFLKLNGSSKDKEQDILSPILYFYGIIEQTQDFIIVMEDIRDRDSNLKPGKQGQTKISDIKKILKMQAKTHANYMGRTAQFEACEFAPKPTDKSQQFISTVVKKSWPRFKSWAREMGLDVNAVESCGDEIVAKGSKWCDVCSKGPLTLVHGDSHCENL
ncbi:hypothetical protein TrLO_g13778 [Triparma laevis f. longispina]|uniref:Uncharacterized protein n=1 Tax=Triparma laevis f. longispina TaxID=1714387 RepID=A0A9W7A2Z4_9STRA|nr:hypothetical protein TrLO_g13778 [Triparma laevis f. longispina]